MKNIELFALFILMFVPMYLLAQKGKVNDNYSYQVRNEYSDLNNDGKEDKVLVTMDTIDETRPLKLQIFLSQPDGKLILAVSSTKIIEPQYPSENIGKFNGFQIPSFFIEHGILQMRSEIENGNITYDFKYKNGNFELIHVSKLINNSTEAYVDEYTTFTDTQFDLVTGIRTETDDQLVSNKPLAIRKNKVLIRPLPKIQDMKFSDTALY